MGETEQDSFFESKEKFQQQLQDIFQTIMRLTGPDQFDQLCQWMEYKQYLTIDDFYDSSYNDPEKFDTKGPATEYKWKRKMIHLSPNVAQKLKSFVKWMTHEDSPYELHDDFLATLTREHYLKFRDMDTLSFSASSPSHHEPYKLKTSFSGESKHQTPSVSQTALNNFKKGTKRDASVYPIFKNDKYYDTFQRSFLANLKAQGLYDVADPDHDPENGDTYEKELFKGKQSFVYSVLVTSLQTEKGRELVKEFEVDARSIILKLHHYHTKSNVATDTIFSDTPAINDGSTMAQFFVGRDTLVCDAYGIKSQKQFINTLYDNIRFREAMTTLITDGGRYEISKKVSDLLRSLFIKQYESEPYHQHQNKAKHRYGNLTGAELTVGCYVCCMYVIS